MSLSFKEIKEKCVSGETILVDKYGNEMCFIGFNINGDLVTERRGYALVVWSESEFKDWKIKQDEKDFFYVWNVKDNNNYWFTSVVRMNKDGYRTDGNKSHYAEHERTICAVFPPIDKDGNEVEL